MPFFFAMSVFISWSGKDSQSHKVATLLRNWLPRVLQNLPCFLSSHDIQAGAMWLGALFKQLEECNIGIICVTSACVQKPWLLFEAGALAKALSPSSKVCPLVIDMPPSALESPLSAFQAKTTSRDDLRTLIDMINLARGPEWRLESDELDKQFDLCWGLFADELQQILQQPDATPLAKPKRPLESVVEELVTLTRQAVGMLTELDATDGPRVLRRRFRREESCLGLLSVRIARNTIFTRSWTSRGTSS